MGFKAIYPVCNWDGLGVYAIDSVTSNGCSDIACLHISGQSWIPTTFSSVGWLYTVGLQSSTRMNFRVDLAYACVPESVGVTIALALSLALSSRCVFSVGPAWLK